MENNTIKIVVAIIGVIGVTLGALIMTGVISFKKNIEFTVIDAKSKNPIENAIIKFDNDSKRTKSDGSADFNVIKKGRKDYSVTKEKYKQFNGTVKITGKENFKEVHLLFAEHDTLVPIIVFESPTDESTQISPVSLMGSCDNLPKGYHFWIVVNPHGSHGWWPQSEVMTKQNNKWSSMADLGGTKGQKFDIHFISADKQAHNEFNEYLSDSKKTGKYPENPLPTGSNSLGYITVIKK